MAGIDNNICKMNYIGPQCRERFLPFLSGGPLHQLGVALAGISDLKGRYCMDRRNPGFGLLLGTLAGEARLTTPKGRSTLLPGDLLLAGPNSAYRYELPPKKTWKIAWLHVKKSKPIQWDTSSTSKVHTCQAVEKLAREMEDLLDETTRVQPRQAEARYAKETYLAVLAERLICPNHHTPLPSRHMQCLESLFAQVRETLEHPWTLTELAFRAGYSAGHLNRMCRQHFGRPALKQLHALRMSAAAGILRQTNLVLRDIAKQVGYTDEFAFSVAFKRHFGLAPSKMRNA